MTKKASYKRHVESAEKAAQAAQLYIDGFSLREVGKRLGVSHEMARKYIDAHLKAIPAAARDELQRHTLEHYQSIIDAFNPAALQGDIGAAGIVLKAREALRRMFGLDAPQQMEVAQTAIHHPNIVFGDCSGAQTE